jgi:exosortase D (VPLPA-CTERM-specific)
MLTALAVPFVLLLLAIPIPQIIFNRIAMPLQTLASQMAVWGIRVFEVPTVRMGNVIDILPKGGIQAISLEVVEACSGIRSLMTLVTLALILAYFTRRDDGGKWGGLSTPDLLRAILLMIAAVPIAVLTNAARVTGTGILTYYYGKQATDATWHDASGWVVYVAALGLLIGVNFGLRAIFQRKGAQTQSTQSTQTSAIRNPESAIRNGIVWTLVISFVISGLAINWFVRRGEAEIARKPLAEMPQKLGDWRQKGSEIKFAPAVESVLKTSDYTMREYGSVDGRPANIYVGYYATQRTGATYHSPQNCLPGAGWVMHSGRSVDITTADGRIFRANAYIIENGTYKDVMIYWYQGRGHREASEYRDKLNTIWDSVTRRRTDGAFVRVMTDVGSDEAGAFEAARGLAGQLASGLGPFIPE